MYHKVPRTDSHHPGKKYPLPPNKMQTKSAAKQQPPALPEEKLDIEAALSPFWAWRITSH
jgi:hypothetical protein